MKKTDAKAQFVLYLVVGGSAFVVDIASFVAMTEAGLHYIVASVSAFIVATLANYLLSYRLAFTRGRFGRGQEITRLFAVAGIGLLLNTAFVWVFVEFMQLDPTVSKIAAVPIVLVWNFLGRRLFVFHPEIPDQVIEVSASIVDRR